MEENAILTFLQPIMDGGWVMLPLFILGLMIYGLGFRMILTLLPIRAGKVTDAQAREWVRNPSSARPQIGEILRYTQEDAKNLDQIQSRFEEVRLNEIPRININVTVLNILVNAAPLLGLLGTVLGMLVTFRGLAMGGAEKTTAMVADGIRVALITTEMGLFLAIPGTFVVYIVRSLRNSYLQLLVRLENITLQMFKEKAG